MFCSNNLHHQKFIIYMKEEEISKDENYSKIFNSKSDVDTDSSGPEPLCQGKM